MRERRHGVREPAHGAGARPSDPEHVRELVGSDLDANTGEESGQDGPRQEVGEESGQDGPRQEVGEESESGQPRQQQPAGEQGGQARQMNVSR
jgi:hypothetical protein